MRRTRRQKYLNTAELRRLSTTPQPSEIRLVGFCLVLTSIVNDPFDRCIEKYISLLQIKEDQGLKK